MVNALVKFGIVTGGLEGMKITNYVPYCWYRILGSEHCLL